MTGAWQPQCDKPYSNHLSCTPSYKCKLPKTNAKPKHKNTFKMYFAVSQYVFLIISVVYCLLRIKWFTFQPDQT